MKFVFLLLISWFSAVMAYPQNKKDGSLSLPPDSKKNLPQINASAGGSRKQGFDVNVDVRQKVWESQNKRHSVDAIGGYSQHLGGAYGSSRPDYRVGAGYRFKF